MVHSDKKDFGFENVTKKRKKNFWMYQNSRFSLILF